MIEQFGDENGGGFFFTGTAHETLIVRSKAAYDGATPSGASMAIHSLLRLAKHLDKPAFHDKAVETLKLYYHQMEAMPSGSGQLLCELAFPAFHAERNCDCRTGTGCDARRIAPTIPAEQDRRRC